MSWREAGRGTPKQSAPAQQKLRKNKILTQSPNPSLLSFPSSVLKYTGTKCKSSGVISEISSLAGKPKCRQTIQQHHEGNNGVMQDSGNMQDEAFMEVIFHSVNIY